MSLTLAILLAFISGFLFFFFLQFKITGLTKEYLLYLEIPVKIMAYLNCRIQILILTANQMAAFHYVELFTLDRVGF